ncbi:hypothetical protein QYF61_023139 [Mycteria americana]|uniref:Uncharacterized protein n=1 Tax=Mycteria americana TaxID=33587 RepID=A0AAN7S0W6_MYCAM|nr:hypothetical protein QYF61_023139 [Mycteria americana]
MVELDDLKDLFQPIRFCDSVKDGEHHWWETLFGWSPTATGILNLMLHPICKKEMHRQWNQGHVSWGEYRDPAWLCRDAIRKAKAQLELNLARDAKNNKKGFYRYVGQKRKIKENGPTLVNKTRELITTHLPQQAEVLNTFFCLSFQ